MSEKAPKPEDQPDESSVAEALRAAVERTLQATTPAATQTRERAAELLDEVGRVGREARAEIARRGQEAGAGLARRGQEASSELARRLEVLEGRLADVEDSLKNEAKPKAED